MSRVTTIGALLAATLFAALVLASPSFAQSPWWHLTAGSRPAYLHAGARVPGVEEVQTVTVKASGGKFVLANMTKQEVEKSEYFIEEGLPGEFDPKFAELEYDAEAATVQAALEGFGLYGEGNVVVARVEKSPSEFEYTLTFRGALAAQPVSLVNTEIAGEPVALEGTVSASETVAGKPGRADGEIYVTAENLGDANVDGVTTPARFSDVLPHGLRAVGIAGTKPYIEGDFQQRAPLPCTLATLTCTLTGGLAPYDQIEMRIAVEVEPGAHSGELNEATITGGGAQGLSIKRPITISSTPVPFGVESYEMGLEEEGGKPTVQAGAHPFQLTTTIALNQEADLHPLELPPDFRPEVTVPALAKDLNFKLPPGLIGNPTPIPQCTTEQFFQTLNGDENECPPDTAVGVATVTVHEPSVVGTSTLTEPIFNLEPRVGEPARFGFYVVIANSPVFIDTSVRTGRDYGVTVSVENITQTAAFLSSEVTFWGVPGDPRHDKQRGWGCLYEARHSLPHPPCDLSEATHPPPFLSLPTSCTTPLQTSVEGDTWTTPNTPLTFTGEFQPTQPLLNCNRLQFSPAIKVAPDGQEASKPTGLTVDVHVPQEVNTNAAGLASSNVKDISVVFPEGVVLNPAAADGLLACSEAQIGLEPGRGLQEELLFTPTVAEAFCPDASKIGAVKITSPLLPPGQPLEGSLYLATPAPEHEAGMNPFNSLVAMYIVAKDPISGVLVKLPGEVSLDQTTGRLVATFENTPQLAFEDAEIHLFGGERAPLATPAHCGTYTTDATFTPWSGTAPVGSSSSFKVTSGPNGSACPGTLPFAPSLAAGTTNNNAGAFSPLITTISREDGNQNIQSVQLHMPPGLSGILAGVKLCGEAQANAGACSAESLIGTTVVSVGLGGDPFSVTGGQVFLTEGYEGAPFGLSIVNPAVAGPFNLGKVIVRAKIEVDPHTAALTITTGTIPHILDGIPLQIKHVNVTVGRPGFTFNPTNCTAAAITGSIGSVEGASSAASVPFQVTNCSSLQFAPKLTITTSGKTSKKYGASLTAKLSYPQAAQGTQANITRAKVDLPVQLPSRLATLQKACTNAQFEANPANCPAGSKVGKATVTTPLLPVPLTGPAIFVSHGSEAFPSLTMVLQGYGVTVDLVGTTFISKAGITSTTFKTVPDVPFNTFTLTLPEGTGSALTAYGDLCRLHLTMPTEFVAQNGLKINRSTPIGVTGCTKAKPRTRAQKLAAALKACGKAGNGKRAACERQGRRKYGAGR